MNTHDSTCRARAVLAALVLAGGASPAMAQVPVDEDGNVVGDYGTGGGEAAAIGDDGLPLKSADDLESLVGPIALYPDDLVAVILPAATYPLQVVEAARFLEALESDPALAPDDDWDDSIVALVNYPEVVELMNQDLDWTWQLGEAVVAQQADVIAAIAAFRDKAAAAGNLNSDTHQSVTRNEDDIIEIEPASEEVIYVPYYEPERVVVYQTEPVYYYYPRAYPLYYYPYPAHYAFGWGYFWGVTTAFSIGWNAHCLNVYHPSFYGHPYYGYNYWNNWWYRSPSVVAYNNDYYDQRQADNRYYQGDRWRPNGYTRLHADDQRITRNRYSPNPATAGGSGGQSRAFASRQNPSRVDAQAARPDEIRDIRQALEASGATRARNATVPQSRQPAPGTPQQANDAGMTVRDVREALDASRGDQHMRASHGPTVSRPSIPTPRPAVPVQRPTVPVPRPTLTTWSESRRPPSGPAPVRQAAPAHSAPAVRQAPAPAARPPVTNVRPSAGSNPPAAGRPAQQHTSATSRSAQSR